MDEANIEAVRDWLTRANHDLLAARTLESFRSQFDTAIYHCQQAGEKAVKAWLHSQNEVFAKTHDVEQLVEQAMKMNAGFAQFKNAAQILTPYAAAFRYPGGSEEPMPTREQFAEALQHAQKIYDFVVDLLPGEARPTQN